MRASLVAIWSRPRVRIWAFRSILLLVALVLLAFLSGTYRARVEAPVTVTRTLDGKERLPLRYLRVHLDAQDPEEPTFKVRLLVYVQDFTGQVPSDPSILRSAGGTYARSNIRLNLRKSGSDLISTQVEASIISLSAGHWRFPFDSADFDFTLTPEPALPITTLRLVNRVPGFLLQQDTVTFSVEQPGTLRVTASLRRNPFTQMLAVLLAVASLVFVFFILGLNSAPEIAAASASYFFSLWSIRAILASQILTFPTLVDYWIVTMSSLLLLGLLLRLAIGPRAAA